MRYIKQLAAGVLAASISFAAAAQTLVVGDQSFNTRAVMEAAGVLDDLPYALAGIAGCRDPCGRYR